MDTIKAFQALGFTEYEARAYTALVNEGELNGYGLAKQTGIPRANIYAVVDKLLKRGAILKAQRKGGQSYSAVAPEQLFRSLASVHERALETAGRSLAEQNAKKTPAPVFNLHGEALLKRAEQIIDACHERLLIALQPTEAARLAGALGTATERGVSITTLCLQACAQVCGGCQGAIHRHALAPKDGPRWLVIVADDTTALMGQLGASSKEGVTTDQPLVAELARAFIRQHLTVAALLADQTNQPDGPTPGPALQQLHTLYPDGGIPAYLRALGAPVAD